MACKRCPHLVKHGVPSKDGQSINFSNRCGLRMDKKENCKHFPFPEVFNYMSCEVYRAKFAGSVERNDVMPTSDIGYIDMLSTAGLADLEII